jgi:zearalenone synthase (highly reducing iterative type I polyketide synthase)
MGDFNYGPVDEVGDIAIIGLSCRFPGSASDPEKFWELLSNKRCMLCINSQRKTACADF